MVKKKEITRIVSFRVTEELYKRLETLSAKETDEAGLTLNPATMARRLMREALDQRDRVKKAKG